MKLQEFSKEFGSAASNMGAAEFVGPVDYELEKISFVSWSEDQGTKVLGSLTVVDGEVNEAQARLLASLGGKPKAVIKIQSSDGRFGSARVSSIPPETAGCCHITPKTIQSPDGDKTYYDAEYQRRSAQKAETPQV